MGEGQAAAGEKSLAGLPHFLLFFPPSREVLCAEYLISTPSFPQRKGWDSAATTRNPIHFCTQQRWYSKHGSLPETRSSAAGEVSPEEEDVWQFLHPSRPRVPCNQPFLEARVGPSGWRHAQPGAWKAGRGAQPHPHEKSCVLHLPAASSWLLILPLSLHVPQEPAFGSGLLGGLSHLWSSSARLSGPYVGAHCFQPGWCNGHQGSTDHWSLIHA